jgi:hypothetical protein
VFLRKAALGVMALSPPARIVRAVELHAGRRASPDLVVRVPYNRDRRKRRGHDSMPDLLPSSRSPPPPRRCCKRSAHG